MTPTAPTRRAASTRGRPSLTARVLAAAVGGACVAFALAGCAARDRAAEADSYQTVTADPTRDPALALREHAEALRLAGESKWPQAQAAAERALAADVMLGPAHNTLGYVHFKQRQYYLAAWEFQYAGKLMPNQAEPRNNLGLVFEATGKLDDAVASYDAAARLEPDNAQYVGNAARARVRRGDAADDVRPLLARLLELDDRAEWLSWSRATLRELDRAPATTPSE